MGELFVIEGSSPEVVDREAVELAALRVLEAWSEDAE